MNFLEYLLNDDLEYLLEAPKLLGRAARQGINLEPFKHILDPKTGKTYRKQNKIKEIKEIIKKLESQGIDKDKIWATYTDIDKLGIYYGARWGGTPLGLYAYPINYVINKLENNENVPYGSNRRFIVLFELNEENVVSMKQGEKEIEGFEKVRKIISNKAETFQNALDRKQRAVSHFIHKKFDKFELDEKSINLLSSTMEGILKRLSSNSYGNTKENIKNLISAEFDEKILGKESFSSEVNELLFNTKIVANLARLKIPELVKKVTEDWSNVRLSGNIFQMPLFELGYGSSGWSRAAEEGLKLSESAIEFFQIIESDPPEMRNINEYLDVIYGKSEPTESSGPSVFLSEDKKYQISVRLYDADDKIKDAYLKNSILKNKNFEQIKKMFAILKNKLTDSLDREEKKRDEYIKSIHFPLEEKLKESCKKYHLDWHKILASTMGEMSFDPISGQFVYIFTKIMAEYIAKTESVRIRSSQQKIWTRLFRELNIHGLVDVQGAGAIHPSEPVQGVFINPKQIKQVAQINNTFTGEVFGSQEDWKLPRELRRQRERQGQRKSSYWKSEDSPIVRSIRSLHEKLESLLNDVIYSGPYYSASNIQSHMLQTSKLIKTYVKLIKSKEADVVLDNETFLGEVNRYFGRIIGSLADKLNKMILPRMAKNAILPVLSSIVQFAISNKIINLDESPMSLYSGPSSRTYRQILSPVLSSQLNLPISTQLSPSNFRRIFRQHNLPDSHRDQEDYDSEDDHDND